MLPFSSSSTTLKSVCAPTAPWRVLRSARPRRQWPPSPRTQCQRPFSKYTFVRSREADVYFLARPVNPVPAPEVRPDGRGALGASGLAWWTALHWLRSAPCSDTRSSANGMRDPALMVKSGFSKRNEGGTTSCEVAPGSPYQEEVMNSMWVCISATKNLKWHLSILCVLQELLLAPMTIQNMKFTNTLRSSLLFRNRRKLNGNIQKQQKIK